MVEIIKHENVNLAIIVRNDFHKSGVTFLTENENYQQLAYMSHEKGKKITPHIHQEFKREIYKTQEVLFIKEGVLKVNFFSLKKKFLFSKFLNQGDLILLMDGGHGFEVMEDLKMIEVKQGPFYQDSDKIKFYEKH